MKLIVKVLKNWTLPVAMLIGVLAYYTFTEVEALSNTKPYLSNITKWLMPTLIFAQLLLSFCKIEYKELVPRKWHLLLVLFQLITTTVIALILLFFNLDTSTQIVLQGAMVCLISPTATAAVVITGKLGGNTSALVTYTMFSNIVAAVVIPLLFPLIVTQEEITFISSFTKILSKVFPLLIAPFLLSLLFKYYIKPIYEFLKCHSGISFYLWSIALAIVTAQTLHYIISSEASVAIKIFIAIAGLITCIIQFLFGKTIGSRYDNTISAGQALGQKNTIFAIWLASTYLNPLSSVAPGSYVLWQNIFNSWQLYKKRIDNRN